MLQRRNRTLLVLAVAAAVVGAALIVELIVDRGAPTRGKQRALIADAPLAPSLRITIDGVTSTFVRDGVVWRTGDHLLGRESAIEALLAELELGQIEGPATIAERSVVGTIQVGETTLVVYGEAIDGRYIERCVRGTCAAYVTRARLVELLRPDGGWIERGD